MVVTGYVLRYVGISGTAYYWHRRKGWTDSIYNAHVYPSIKLAKRAKGRNATYQNNPFFIPYSEVKVHYIQLEK